MRQVTACFFGPMRVSVMFDANGANTTAAAAVLAAAQHLLCAEATAWCWLPPAPWASEPCGFWPVKGRGCAWPRATGSGPSRFVSAPCDRLAGAARTAGDARRQQIRPL